MNPNQAIHLISTLSFDDRIALLRRLVLVYPEVFEQLYSQLFEERPKFEYDANKVLRIEFLNRVEADPSHVHLHPADIQAIQLAMACTDRGSSKIGAIRVLRDITKLFLKDAKEAVEQLHYLGVLHSRPEMFGLPASHNYIVVSQDDETLSCYNDTHDSPDIG